MPASPGERLLVALDVESAERAVTLATQLDGIAGGLISTVPRSRLQYGSRLYNAAPLVGTMLLTLI